MPMGPLYCCYIGSFQGNYFDKKSGVSAFEKTE